MIKPNNSYTTLLYGFQTNNTEEHKRWCATMHNMQFWVAAADMNNNKELKCIIHTQTLILYNPNC